MADRSVQPLDAQMGWLADDRELKELPFALAQQASKSLVARMSFAFYRSHFEVIRAETRELRDQVYQLRYQVYVREHNFENSDDYPEQRERDEYDGRSQHILLRHRRSGAMIGTARIVLPNEDDPASSFPVQTVSSHSILHDPKVVRHAIEFSRLAISRERLNGCYAGSGAKSGRLSRLLAKQLHPYLSVGLIAGVLELACENGYPVMYAVMEPFLIRNLGHIGIEIPFVDAPVEYHGLRHPCVVPSLHNMFAVMKKKDRAAWEIVTNRGRTQELALVAQTKSEQARRGVARAFRLAEQLAPVVLRAPDSHLRARNSLQQIDAIVSHPSQARSGGET